MIALFSFTFFYSVFPFHYLTSLTFLALQLDVELLSIKQSPFGYVIDAKKHIEPLICFHFDILLLLAALITFFCRTPVKIVEG